MEKAEQGGYDAIGAALATVDFARRDELAGTLKQGWSAASPQFQLFYDEAKRPRAERKIERTNSWYDAVTKVIDTANLASTAVSNRAWMNDPFIARMIQVRRFAWQVRDRYGIHCSSLRSNVNASKPLDDAQKRSVAQWDGTIASGWAGMAELLAAPDVAAELVTAATDAKATTDGALKQIGDLTKNFDGSGKPAMPAAEWNTLCQSPFASIVAVANKALDQSIVRAETVQAKALTNLVVQSLAFLLALAVTLAGVYVVRNRLHAPGARHCGRHRQDQRPRLRNARPAIQVSRRVRHHGGRTRKPARERGDRGTPGPGARSAAGAPARPPPAPSMRLAAVSTTPCKPSFTALRPRRRNSMPPRPTCARWLRNRAARPRRSRPPPNRPPTISRPSRPRPKNSRRPSARSPRRCRPAPARPARPCRRQRRPMRRSRSSIRPLAASARS
ncbi:hypothetical protein ACVWWO_005548 [Bradyrhizobium sp. F1.13.1]